MLYPKPNPLTDPAGPTYIEWKSETYRRAHFGADPTRHRQRTNPCPGCGDPVHSFHPAYPWHSRKCRELHTNSALKLTGTLENEAYLKHAKLNP